MIFVDELKKAIDVMLLKDKTPKAMGVGEALGFYYKATLIPMILTIIISVIVGTLAIGLISGVLSTVTQSSSVGSLFGLAGVGFGLIFVLFIVLTYWVITPIGLLIEAAIYHVIGKLFRQFKEGYNATFNAMVYTAMISSVLLFLMFIPLLGIIIAIIASIWAFISIIIWIARFQKISGLMSFLILIVTWIIIYAIIFLVIGGIFLHA